MAIDGIDRDAWLRAVRDLIPDGNSDPNVLTLAEFKGILGLSRSTCQLRIKQMLDAGKVEKTSKYIVDNSGRRQRVGAYRLVSNEAPRKRRA